ncbi:hypothetical protein KGQ71_03335 [Patescibacteria group bacterium]|nr:hypothetical protein [Patescibacteria group bacterium]
MGVIKTTESSSEARIVISNGDLEALNQIKEKYHLKDGADVIVFALGILSQGAGKPVTIEKEDGSTVKLLPSDRLTTD